MQVVDEVFVDVLVLEEQVLVLILVLVFVEVLQEAELVFGEQSGLQLSAMSQTGAHFFWLATGLV